MPEPGLRIADGALLIGGAPGPDAAPAARLTLEILATDGSARTVPLVPCAPRSGGTVVESADDEVHATITAITSGPADPLDLDLQLRWTGPPTVAGLRFVAELAGEMHEPRWLVPGCFYRENRPEGTAGSYPRATLAPDPEDPFASPTWSFRSDRAACAAVFGWTDRTCVGLATDAATHLGLSGLGFAVEEGRARVWIDLPYREEPVVYRGDPTPAPPVVPDHRWQPGDELAVTVLLAIDEPRPHAYRRLLRAAYDRDRERHGLAPWMPPSEAAGLVAHGLYTWHWHPEHDALYETAAFDRTQAHLDRASMHVAWVSGIPWAQTLLAYGRRTGELRYVEAGQRVIEHLCSARTPAGTFWGEWRRDDGWGCGWNRHPDRLHARTLAEATLFTVRAVREELRRGVEHPTWRAAIEDNLRYVLAAQDPDGNLGSYYNQRTGQVEDRSGAGGLLWIAALAEAAALFGHDAWLEAAARAGRYYARFVEDAFIHGAPEDVHLAPTSEDGYNAVIAYVRLHELAPDPDWLELASLAADWTMTFRWTYNIAFDPHTLLGTYDFHTRGADNASPPNQHLHAYGLIAVEELVRLARAVGDDYYRERARDNVACFLQMIARSDGDFNAGRGMVTERYYHTDCFQAKGSMLTLSHAWCLGVSLLACQVAMDDPDAHPEPALLGRDRTEGRS